MTKPKTIKDCVRMSFAIEKKQADQIRKMARLMSVQEKRQITASEAIRMAVETVYPLPKQMELF